MFGVSDNNQPAAPVPGPAPEPTHNPISGAHTSPSNGPPMPSRPATGPTKDELMNLKQQVLGSLTPMVNQLEQGPEEKFKTMMMLIQASDNSGLIKEAYAAAQAIPDDKARAQALIDVINEINYFTSKT